MRIRLGGRPVSAGEAEGISLVLAEPLSWWGGIDPADGTVIDHNHPQFRAGTAGRILVLPHGRGSSGGSAVLAESIRAGTGPAGLVLHTIDPILVVGVMVAEELYADRSCPLVVVDDGYELLATGFATRIHPDGTIDQWLPVAGDDRLRVTADSRPPVRATTRTLSTTWPTGHWSAATDH